MGDVMES